MKRFTITLLILAFSLPALAEKSAFTLKDLYRVDYVGTPRVSPDGEQIAFTVADYEFSNATRDVEIWIMNSDGSGLSRLTDAPEPVSRPRWHPDGSQLMFVMEDSVSESAQAYTVTLSDTAIRQLTHFSMGVGSPSWTPDGDHLVFTSRVFPEAGADSEHNAQLQDDMDAGPVKAHMTDDLFYRHWNFWKDGKRTHTFVLDLQTGRLTDLTPGDHESPRFDLGGSDGYDISPDGAEITYVSNHDPEPQSSTNGDLWVVSINDGEPENITAGNPAFDGHPKYSPDGRYIAYTMQRKPGYESDRFRLALYDRKEETHQVLTKDFKYSVGEFHWSPDSRSIYFTSQVEGHVPLYRLSLSSGKISQLVDHAWINGFMIGPTEKHIYFSSRAVDKPTEIYSTQSSASEVLQLTHFNRKLLNNIDFRPVETSWVRSTDGTKIHLFIVKPHDFDPDKSYPLILNVHGGPQGMFGNSFRGDYQVYPGSGYVVAFSNPRGSTGYGQAFTAAISGDWGGQVYRDLMEVTDYLAGLSYVDSTRMGAMGWSYGGYMMNWFEGHTGRFKALASMMGVYDLRSFYSATEELWFPEWDLGGTPWTSDQYEKWSPSNYVENFSTPCLVITGMKDFRVPYTQSLMLFTDLQKMGIPSRLIVFENDGHWPSFHKSMPLYYNAHLEWFHKYLGGEPAPFDSEKMWRNQILNWGETNGSEN